MPSTREEYRRAMEVTRRTDLSPAALWAVMGQLRRWPQWQDTLNELDPLEPERPEEVGAAYRADVTALPTAVWTITEWLPERSFTWVTSAPAVTTTSVHALEPDGDGTLIRLSLTWSGPMARPVAAALEGMMQDYLEHEALELESHARDLWEARQAGHDLGY